MEFPGHEVVFEKSSLSSLDSSLDNGIAIRYTKCHIALAGVIGRVCWRWCGLGQARIVSHLLLCEGKAARNTWFAIVYWKLVFLDIQTVLLPESYVDGMGHNAEIRGVNRKRKTKIIAVRPRQDR